MGKKYQNPIKNKSYHLISIVNCWEKFQGYWTIVLDVILEKKPI